MSHEVLGMKSVPQFWQGGVYEQGSQEEPGAYKYHYSIEHPSFTTPPTTFPSLAVHQILSFTAIPIDCHIPAILFNGYRLLQLAPFHPTIIQEPILKMFVIW
jgi:hypothetical protein